MRKYFFFLITFSLFQLHITVQAQQSALKAQIQKTVSSYLEQKDFSGSILVAQEGKPVFHQSYGLAYIPASDTIRNDYHFAVASVTKTFTAIRILQLVQEGKLELNKSLTDYLPEWSESIPTEVHPHHLLLHISGLSEVNYKKLEYTQSASEILSQSFAHKPKSKFGEFYYNDTDYLLLGLLVEKITGNPWQEEIQKHILEPCQMQNTGFLEYGYYPKNFAYTYTYNKKGKATQDPYVYVENFYAAGNMYSTAEDLLKLDQALYSNKLLNEDSKALLSISYPEYGYVGYSVWNYQYPFVDAQPTIMERRGGISGANVVWVRLTDDNYTIIILSNDDRFNPDSFGDAGNLREALIRSLY